MKQTSSSLSTNHCPPCPPCSEPIQEPKWKKFYKIGLIFLVLLASNILSWQTGANYQQEQVNGKLYLLNEAKPYVYDIEAFEQKVRDVSYELYIPPEWLMAVMHSESRFDASVANHKGSGATGLIQWMPFTAKEFNITIEKLRNLNHIEQLDFVRKYLQQKQDYHSEFRNLTDAYLAILYPRAIGKESCYVLYKKPSKQYEQNSGLDRNKDGQVTVQDIDTYLQVKYTQAYRVKKPRRSLYARFINYLF